MRRFLPKSFLGQTVLVLLVGLTVSHVLSMAIYSTDRIEVLTLSGGREIAHRIASITRLLDETPPEWRERILHATDAPSLRVVVTPESKLAKPENEDWRAALVRTFLERLLRGSGDGSVIVHLLDAPDNDPAADQDLPITSMHMHMMRMVEGSPVDQSLRVSIRLKDGNWLNFAAAIPESTSLWSNEAILSMVLMAVGVLLFSLWVVRRLVRPMTTFARAAERLGRDVSAPPLTESGPSELRQAVRAFNEMQDRLRRLIENRTRMLAAISHDLRTPITLLRLRAEFIEDEDEQRKTMATLDEMESMIASTLAFARDDAESEDRRVVDMAALIGSICDDLADTGLAVEFDPPSKTPFECRAMAMKRALTNLLENAVKYGGNARAQLVETAEAIEIVIDDDGPGIAEDELESVFSPFYRVEQSRSRETGGVGLGLSIARTIVHAHGGEILLSNREDGGLRALIQLPR
jgi:signal transduction histidine kinase